MNATQILRGAQNDIAAGKCGSQLLAVAVVRFDPGEDSRAEVRLTPVAEFPEIGQLSWIADMIGFHSLEIQLPVSIADGDEQVTTDRIDGSIPVRSVRELGGHAGLADLDSDERYEGS